MDANDYEQRIERTLSYIAVHLDGDLSLERLADVACFSAFHFHRVYRAMVGETVAETVKRHRLHRAAGELLSSSKDITRIAKRAGYSSQSAFSRAFRTAYGIPPGRYKGQTMQLRKQLREDSTMYDVSVVEIDPISVAATQHRGDYMKIGTAFEKLATKAVAAGIFKPASRSFGVYQHDPKSIAEADLRSMACLEVPTAWTPSAGLEKTTVAGGRYATVVHRGPYAELADAYDWLFATWLPGSGEEAADRPMVEEYLNSPKTTPMSELETRVYLPIA